MADLVSSLDRTCNELSRALDAERHAISRGFEEFVSVIRDIRCKVDQPAQNRDPSPRHLLPRDAAIDAVDAAIAILSAGAKEASGGGADGPIGNR